MPKIKRVQLQAHTVQEIAAAMEEALGSARSLLWIASRDQAGTHASTQPAGRGRDVSVSPTACSMIPGCAEKQIASGREAAKECGVLLRAIQ